MKYQRISNILILLTVILSILFFNHSSPASEELTKKIIKYGVDMQVVLEVEIKDAKATIDFWIREFFDGAGFDCETMIYKDSKRFFKAFQNGSIDVATTTAINYIHLQEYTDPQVAFIPVQNGKKTVQYLLLVPADADKYNIMALKGKQLSLKKNDDVGRLFLNTYLLENNIPDAEGFFDAISEKTQHSQAVLSVFFGQSDLCITLKSTFDTMKELNPQLGQKLKAMAISPELVSVVVFFHKNTGENLKAIFKSTVKNILQDPRGRQFLVIFKLENLVPLITEDLVSLKTLMKKNQELKRRF